MFREDPWVDNPAIPTMPDGIAQSCWRAAWTRTRSPGFGASTSSPSELMQLYQRLIGAPYPRTKPEAAQLLADALNNQALSLLDLGRISESEQLWQQALATDPHHLHTRLQPRAAPLAVGPNSPTRR